jgi:hypothetical protein
MENAIDLAKKYGLEHYLDKPAELNDAIFHLLLLQETIQIEKSRNLAFRKSTVETISLKRTVHGAFIAACTGDRTYRYAVETALKAGTAVLAVFQRGRFSNVLRSMGVPEEKIAEYGDSIIIDDNTHCIDQE